VKRRTSPRSSRIGSHKECGSRTYGGTNRPKLLIACKEVPVPGIPVTGPNGPQEKQKVEYAEKVRVTASETESVSFVKPFPMRFAQSRREPEFPSDPKTTAEARVHFIGSPTKPWSN
jgi:hypothetical protein